MDDFIKYFELFSQTICASVTRCFEQKVAQQCRLISEAILTLKSSPNEKNHPIWSHCG